METRLLHIFTLAALSTLLHAQILVDELMVLETPSGHLEGTLLRPPTAEKVPLVLIIAGSGPTDRNGNNVNMKNNSLKLLAEGLKANNIATLRYDKRGVGKSSSTGIKESDLRFEHYIKDAKEWIDLLKKDQRFSSISVAGHSEGSLIGMVACQDATIEKFISIAGAGYPAAAIIREQLKGQAKAVLDLALPILDQIEIGETVSTVPPMLHSIFRPSVQRYMISWFKYDPREEIRKLSCPILVIQGTTDIQVSIENARALKQANTKAKLSFIEGMNHILKDAPADRMQNIATYNQTELALHHDMLDTIVNFISTPSL
ncbi:MAG: alpha/beta hydrolase [Bacteroidales bacterium]|jgi:pimeloyl-ACP methyl ester carboxylesterase|nr:alpha/beta hydrolase [Bacteroidales bacterium]